MPLASRLHNEHKLTLRLLAGAAAILCASWATLNQGLSRVREPIALPTPGLSTLSESCQASARAIPELSELLGKATLLPSARGYNSIGFRFAQQQNFSCAISAFGIALSLDPKFWEARYNLALALVRRSERERAADEFRLVIQQKPDFPPAHNALGLVLEELGGLDAAADEFKAVLRLSPHDARAASNLAMVLHTQKKYPAEIFYLRQALAWDLPQELAYQMRLALGLAYYQNGDTDEAIDLLRRLVTSNPKSAEAHYSLATVYAKNIRYKEAKAEYEEVLRLDPEDNAARLSLAKALIEIGDNAAALPYLQEYTRRVPKDYEGYLVTGQAYRRLGELTKAAEEFRQAAELKPDSFDARYNLGYVLARAGNVDEAIEQLEAAKKLNPHAAEVPYQLGLIFKKKGELRRAEEELRAFQEAERWSERERTAQLLVAKGNDLLLKGDAQGALAAYKEALELEPSNAKMHYNLALALEKLGRRDEEKRELEKTLELDPNLDEAHNQLGILLMAMGKASEAERELRAAIRINPTYAEAENNLGTLYGRQGKSSEAEALFRQAIQNNPQYAQAYVNLGLTLASEGKYAEAEHQLEQALRVDPNNSTALTALNMVKTKTGHHAASPEALPLPRGKTSTAERLRDPGWWPTKGTYSRDDYAGPIVCAECHTDEAATQIKSAMAHALELASEWNILTSHSPLRFRLGSFSYEIASQGNQSIYSVRRGSEEISVPILYGLGFSIAGQTYVFEWNGSYYESHVSFYPQVGLDITIGHFRSEPPSLEDALGKPMNSEETRKCFACHATASIIDNRLEPSYMIPGVTCEACHGPGARHVTAMKAAKVRPTFIFNPGLLSAADSVDFCGACHRTWRDVKILRTDGLQNIRFQPYRLQKSRCWVRTGRITCLSCHNPHEALAHGVVYYDQKCLACHLSHRGEQTNLERPGPPCPVSAKNCVNCHMPKYRLEGGPFEFTDHQIRVVHPGEHFPS